MTKRQYRRILEGAKFLEGPVARADARERKLRGRAKFDMQFWAAWNNPGDEKAHDMYPKRIGLTPSLCGTKGCALGWMTVRFPRRLKIYLGSVCMQGSECDPAAMFFGMTETQAHEAFTPNSDGLRITQRTPTQAARVLRRIAAEGKAAGFEPERRSR